MKRNFKYDPEDLESLLLHKQFEELYPEEKEFVLKHMDSPEEYASMRNTLLAVVDDSESAQPLKPKSATKKSLMREFQTGEKGGISIWLNSLFLQCQRKPQLAFGFLATVVIIVVAAFWFLPANDKIILADNMKTTKETVETKKKPAPESIEPKQENEMPAVKREVKPKAEESERVEPLVEVTEDEVLEMESDQLAESNTADTEAQSQPAELAEEKQAENKDRIVVTDEMLAEESFLSDDAMGNRNAPKSIDSVRKAAGGLNKTPAPGSIQSVEFLLKGMHTSM